MTTTKKSTSTPAGKPRARKATPPAAPASTVSEARKPFYAYVGASDLAVARLRALSDAARARADAARAGALPAQLSAQLSTQLPAQLRALQGKAQEAATGHYAALAARGEKVVTDLRGKGVTEQAEKAARTTLARAKAARTAAEQAVKQTIELLTR